MTKVDTTGSNPADRPTLPIVEVSPEMLEAGIVAFCDTDSDALERGLSNAFRAMLAASRIDGGLSASVCSLESR